MTTRAQLDLALWNLAQNRAKDAYDQAPDAYAQLLCQRCTACAYERHHACRKKDCPCREVRHTRGWFTW